MSETMSGDLGLSSMTGYGEAVGESERVRLAVKIRSVNHRALDLHLHLPDLCAAEEPALRRSLSRKLHRGRVEVRVEVDWLRFDATRIRVEEQLVERLGKQVDAWTEQGLVQGELSPGELLLIPGVVSIEAQPEVWGESERGQLQETVRRAREALQEARRTEGQAIVDALEERLGTLRRLIAQLESRREEVRDGLAVEIRTRLEDLLSGVELPPDRILTEAALLADRSDIGEELDRLHAHLAHFHERMAGPPPHGKSLDFLGQEIARELNTIGAKCRDSDMSRWVVEARSACEQLREQLQNVE